MRFRHGGGVWAIAFFPDGRRLASLGDDFKTRAWDVVTGRRLGKIEINDRSFECLTVSADGKHVFLGGPGGVAVWEWEKQDLSSFQIDNDSIVGLALSGTGKTLVAQAREGHVRLWNMATARVERAIPVLKGLSQAFGVAADGRTLVVVAPDGKAVVWDTADGAERRRLKPPDDRRLNRVAISADGSRVVGTFERGQEACSLAVWETATGRLLHALPLSRFTQQAAMRLDVSADGKEAVTADSTNKARAWDLVAGRIRREMTVSLSVVASALVSPDGRTLVTAGSATDPLIRFWDLSTGGERRVDDECAGDCGVFRFAPDGRHLATGSDDGSVRLWPLPTNGTHRRLVTAEHYVTGLAFSDDSTSLAAVTFDNRVMAWQSDGRKLGETRPEEWVLAIGFTPGRRSIGMITRGRPAAMETWDPETGKGDRDPVHIDLTQATPGDVAMSADLRVVTFEVDRPKAVLGWDRASRRTLPEAPHAFGRHALSRDARRVATVIAGAGVTVRDVQSGADVARFRGEDAEWSTSWPGLAFSPDGRWLLLGDPHCPELRVGGTCQRPGFAHTVESASDECELRPVARPPHAGHKSR
jgi:hypothetical protein